MNGKEIVLSAFDFKETERLPAAIFGGGVWTYHRYGEEPEKLVKNPKRMSEIVIEVAEKIRSDIVYAGSGLNNCLPGALGGRVVYRKVGAPDFEPLVSSADDLKKLDLARIDSDPVLNNIREATRIVSERIGERYVHCVTASRRAYALENNPRGFPDIVKDGIAVYSRQIKFFEGHQRS